MQKMAKRTNCLYNRKSEDGIVACRFYHLFRSKGRFVSGEACWDRIVTHKHNANHDNEYYDNIVKEIINQNIQPLGVIKMPTYDY
jgi:hypothetical protein